MKRDLIETALAVGIVVGIVVTGAALVATTHESRRRFQELEALKNEADRLQEDWSALTLEANTLAGHSTIDRIARSELGMIEPDEQLHYVAVPQ
jgi:cell division protein FtsL